MSSETAPDTQVTRRRLLQAAIVGTGALIVGGAGAALDRAISSGVPSSSPDGRAAFAAARPSPVSPAAPSPSASAPTGPRQAFRSRPDLTPPALLVSRRAAGLGSGLVFLTPANGAGSDGPMIVDESGELVWLRPDTKAKVANATNFRPVTYNGKPALAWWEGAVNGGIGIGEAVLVDTSYAEITRVRGANGEQNDLHEFLVTPQGTALFFIYRGVDGPVAAGASPLPWKIFDCIVQEVDIASGRLVWEWHAVDHIAVDESFLPAPTSANLVYDYLHTNSIEIDTDGNLLVSARNTSAVYKVDRSSGDILWRLGGKRSDFTFDNNATFGWQHDVRRRGPTEISLFDNETTGKTSRGLVLRVDEAARHVSVIREYRHATPLLTMSQGDLQYLPNGNVFVGWGSNAYCSEYTSSGDLLYDASFPASVQSYRAFRLPWTGVPAESPAIAVEAGADGKATVYMSWNGATEIASWQVVTGRSAADLSAAATVARTGFETSAVVPKAGSVIAARALDSSGNILATSPLVPVRG